MDCLFECPFLGSWLMIIRRKRIMFESLSLYAEEERKDEIGFRVVNFYNYTVIHAHNTKGR